MTRHSPSPHAALRRHRRLSGLCAPLHTPHLPEGNNTLTSCFTPPTAPSAACCRHLRHEGSSGGTQRGLLLPLLIVGLCGGWRPALQPVAAQWSYGGPRAGCTDVLDAFTGGIRGNVSSGSVGGFTVASAPRFALRGPDCFVRGAFAILFDVAAMRAAALAAGPAGSYPNVSIVISGGVRFEGSLDINAALNSSDLRLPTLEVLFAKNASDPFDPDALPVDVAVGRPHEASGVTWTVWGVVVAPRVYAYRWMHLLTLRNGQHIPRGSSIAVVNAAITMTSWMTADTASVNLALVYASTPLVLVGASQLAVHNTTITVEGAQLGTSLTIALILFDNVALTLQNAAQVTVTSSAIRLANIRSDVYITICVFLGWSATLLDASQMLLADTTITAVDSSAMFFIFNVWRINRQTLFNTARLTVSGTTFLAVNINCSRSFTLYGIMIINPVTLYNASRIIMLGSAANVTNIRASSLLRMSLFTSFSVGNPLILHNHSRINVTGCAVRAIRCSAGSTFIVSLLHHTLNSPLVLSGASQVALTDSTASATDCRVEGGEMTVGGLVEAYNYDRNVMSVAGDARIMIDGVTVSAEGVTNAAGLLSWLQVVVFGEVNGWNGDKLDLYDRGTVFITRSTATVARSTLGALNTNGRPLAMVYSYPMTVFRDGSTVRVCDSTAAVTNVTIAGTFYPGPYTATPGAAWTAFGNTTIIGACNGSSEAAADRCGLSTAGMQCTDTPVATSTTAATATTASGNSSNRNASGAAPAEGSGSALTTGLIVGGVVLVVVIVVGVAAGRWIAHCRKQRAHALPDKSDNDVLLSSLDIPSSDFTEHQL